ncbi:hypothetical protein FYK55_11720 [Roseiconus nitratireducens]|uniref:Uncharacterized protein n=1 Tax=Roseiconus nitratireducens TaxID=2605748 RepID=A0A5M6DBQ4_9BACT|nr:hypothetical protein [Roseiconus nitratireducens]KAA5543830.1 hypothetical protein FYK55_11720 [Roseiconus nitratireducens]
MNPMNLLRRWQRRLIATVRFLVTLPSRLNLMDLVIHAFSFPQHEWARRLRRDVSQDDVPVSWTQWINPIYWIAWLSRFAYRWITTRPYMTLAPAVPAVLFAIALTGTVIAVLRRDPTQTQTIYLDTLKTALASDNTQVASVAAQRLLEIDPDNLEHQYQVAILDHELGHTESARSAIFRLAMQNEYGPAALWMLKSLIYQSSDSDSQLAAEQLVRRDSWSDQEVELCHRSAAVAMEKLPSERAAFARKMYAGFLSANGFTGSALRQYRMVAESDPGVALIAAQLAAKTGDYSSADRFAQIAVRHLEPKMMANPTSVPARLQLAQALVLTERDDDAYNLLLDGLALTPDPTLTQAAGEALIFKSERLKRNVGETETLGLRANLLSEALELAPESPLVMESIVQFAIDCAGADEDGIRRVRESLLSQVTPAVAYFVEGTALLMAGKTDAAQETLELAASEGSEMPGLLNNLAVALSLSDKRFLPQALDLSNEALRQLPGHPSLLETRGQILLRLQRYEEAIVDLEKTLANPAMRPTAHAGLAEAYGALGNKELARRNQILAKRYGGSPAL